MSPSPYLALLRGINVGGNNIIKMSALKECFERLGFKNVTTYIQSGNVVFDAPNKPLEQLTRKIERVLSAQFNYEARIVVVSYEQLKLAVTGAPKGFGQQPNKYRYDVIFLKPPLTAGIAIKSVSLKAGVDQAQAGKNVLYFWRLISKATQSHLPRIIKLPIYQQMTIRNCNTTSKLLTLMEARAKS